VRRRPPPAIAATLPSTNHYKTFTAHEIKTFVCHSLPSTRNFVAPCLRGSTLVLPPPLFYRHLQTRLVMRSALSHFSSTDAGRRVAVASSEMGTDRRRRSAQGFPHKVTHRPAKGSGRPFFEANPPLELSSGANRVDSD
jgi:hypothetical protein